MLESALIINLKKNYNLSNPVILKNLGGFKSHNLLILEGDKNLVLKCISNTDAVKAKKLIHTWKFLDHHKMPVPKIIPAVSGESITIIQNQFCILNENQAGKCFHETNFNEFSLKNTAETLFKFHQLGRSAFKELSSFFEISLKQKKQSKSLDLLQILNTVKNDKIKNILMENVKSRKKLMTTLQLEKIENFALRMNELIHGDFHNENILYTDSHHISSLLDFENVRIGDGFTDVIHFIRLGCCNTGFNENNLHLANIFAKNYLSYDPRSEENIIQNIKLYLKNYTESYFFENLFFKTKNSLYLKFIERDTKTFQYFSSRFDDFYQKVFMGSHFY